MPPQRAISIAIEEFTVKTSLFVWVDSKFQDGEIQLVEAQFEGFLSPFSDDQVRCGFSIAQQNLPHLFGVQSCIIEFRKFPQPTKTRRGGPTRLVLQ